jgi:hypothetical protein
MKSITILIASIFLSLTMVAQTITLQFRGTNKTRNYQVVVDGDSYYSNTNKVKPGNAVQKSITINDVDTGSHTLEVYRAGNIANRNNGTISGTPVFTTNFRVREGYNMIIGVRANGRVTFAEQKMSTSNGDAYQNNYDQLYSTINSYSAQSDRINSLRAAFNSPNNYFTSSQVRQLLSLIYTESVRLELAKLAYPGVTDPANYTVVNNVLTQQSSRDELYNFTHAAGTTSVKQAMSNAAFSQLLQRINAYSSAWDRVRQIRESVSDANSYYNVSQLRQLMSIASSETDRLDIAKMAYRNTIDPLNYSQLFDLLSTQASRDEIVAYIRANGGTVNYTYRTPMSDAAFNQLVQKASNHFLPWDKVRDVKAAVSDANNYFTTAQVRQLMSIVTSEADRLDIAKTAFKNVTDAANYRQLDDMFSNQATRDELNTYIINHPQQ